MNESRDAANAAFAPYTTLSDGRSADFYPQTFREVFERWPVLTAAGRARIFDRYPIEVRKACWAEVSEGAGLRIESEMLLEERWEQEWPPPKQRRSSLQTLANNPRARTRRNDEQRDTYNDPLKNIEGHVYFEVIAGIAVPVNGWVSCPMPDHEDAHPSCQVRGTRWRCWSCGAGGSIIDLAAAVWGIEPRGQGFGAIRRRVAAELLGSDA